MRKHPTNGCDLPDRFFRISAVGHTERAVCLEAETTARADSGSKGWRLRAIQDRSPSAQSWPQRRRRRLACLDVSFQGRSHAQIKPGAEVELGQVIHTFRCQFVSNVTLVRTGQRFAIRNEDNFPHSVSITFLNNREQSTSALPPGPEQFIKLKKRERIPIPMTCGFHPWMRSYLVVTDHPYAVLTQPDGKFEMDLPAGDHELQVRHMVGKGGYIDQVIQQGEAVKWPKGKIRHVEVNGVNKVRITDGETVDLGVILIQ